MDEEGEDVISIGGRPKSSKEPNPLNQARRDARERGGGRQRGRGQRGRGQEGRGDAHEKGEERQVEQAPQQEAQLQEPQSKIPVRFLLLSNLKTISHPFIYICFC